MIRFWLLLATTAVTASTFHHMRAQGQWMNFPWLEFYTSRLSTPADALFKEKVRTRVRGFIDGVRFYSPEIILLNIFNELYGTSSYDS